MADRPDFTIVMRGYDREEVDRYLASAPGSAAVPAFRIVMRGYERTQVDAYVRSQASPAPAPATTGPTVPAFTIVMRGYERTEVDRYVVEAGRRIAELEEALRVASRGR